MFICYGLIYFGKIIGLIIHLSNIYENDKKNIIFIFRDFFVKDC